MSVTLRSEVAQLLRRVPTAPDYKLPPGASDNDISVAEHQLGFALPKSLHEWLKLSNGPRVGPGGMLGVNVAEAGFDMTQCLLGHSGWIERRFIPVAGDGCGNYYIIAASAKSHPIIFLDTIRDPLKPAYCVGSDLWHFLRFLFLKELGETKWPFARDHVCSLDPDIVNVSVAPFPWDLK